MKKQKPPPVQEGGWQEEMYQTTGGILSQPNCTPCVGALEQDPKLARYANGGPQGLLGVGS